MKRLVVSAAVLGLAVTGMAQSYAAPAVNKVTGGGQITTADQRGAGSTVAFTGQSQGTEGTAAKGQFQLQLRNADGTKETIHGTISCVVVLTPGEGGMAVLGGQSRSGEDFRIDVTDNGQGGDSTDMISVRRDGAARDGADVDMGDNQLCDRENESANMMLGRGNVKIHKAKA